MAKEKEATKEMIFNLGRLWQAVSRDHWEEAEHLVDLCDFGEKIKKTVEAENSERLDAILRKILGF